MRRFYIISKVFKRKLNAFVAIAVGGTDMFRSNAIKKFSSTCVKLTKKQKKRYDAILFRRLLRQRNPHRESALGLIKQQFCRNNQTTSERGVHEDRFIEVLNCSEKRLVNYCHRPIIRRPIPTHRDD